MASDENVDDTEASETDVLSATEFSRPARKPFYRDPLSIIGWGIALASIVAYWYFFVRKPVPKPGAFSDHIMARAICRQMRKHARFGTTKPIPAGEREW